MKILRGTLLSAAQPERVTVMPRGYLAAEDDGHIAYVGTELPQQYAGAPVEDWGDALILQSFADMHLHAPQYPMVGLGMDLPLLPWLETYAFPVEAQFADPAFARACCRQLCAELVENGTTRVCIFSSLHRESTLILMEELERAGICGYAGKVTMDRRGGKNLEETTEESMRETLRWLDECQRFRHVKPILTPRFTPSCTNELMAFLGKLAAERELPVQSHLSENAQEIALVRELHPDCAQYWETYRKYGLWRRSVMAHCVHSDARERRAMREAGVLAVHCPDSNLALCSGTAPVKRMLREGVQVALGSDIAGGAILPMPGVMGAAIHASKMRCMMYGDDPLTPAEAYYLATSAGHRYFGDAPGFAVGNPLHAVVADDSALFSPARTLTPEERLERLIDRGGAAQLRAVYSAGRRIK